MLSQQRTNNSADEEGLPAAETGNASNPSPRKEEIEPVNDNQLLNEKAEKYIREVASIEDVPDAQDQQDMDEAIERGKKD
jgi:hypothetical protein